MEWTPERIKTLRQKLGLTQEDMAKRLGYSRRETIAEFEAGKHSPSPQTCIILDMLEKEAAREG